MGTANLIIIILPRYFHVISLYTISVKYAVFYSTLQLMFITCIALSDRYAIMLIFTYIRATCTVVNSFHRYQRERIIKEIGSQNVMNIYTDPQQVVNKYTDPNK